MKFAINFPALTLAALSINGSAFLVHGVEDISGLRGAVSDTAVQPEALQGDGEAVLPSEQRKLQAGQSARTPLVQNVSRKDNGGSSSANWPFGPFPSRPAFSKMSFDLASSGDINLDKIRADPSETAARVSFQDRNADDDYFTSLTGVELPADTQSILVSFPQLTGCFNSPPEPEVPGKIPIMIGFQVDYAARNFDRNVQHLRVQVETIPGTNQPIIRACHADFNKDDVYNLAVRYALVDESVVFGFDEFSNTKNGGGLDDSVVFNRPPNTVAVINGFDLEFLNGDRDIQKVLVELNQDGRVLVNFSDSSKNDSYRWKVNAAYIGAEF